MPKVFIIAEAGINHNGSLQTAKAMVDVAAKAGADAVKFQTFQASALVSKFASKARYQKTSADKNESQLDMVRKLQLDVQAHRELLRHCHKRKIIFLSAPFDLESIDLLANLGLDLLKIPSGEITNLPYLRKIGSLRKRLILSTGMSDLAEVRKALAILSQSGTKKENLTVLHCNTEYPTPFQDVHLRAMVALQKSLGVSVGYSDHTPGIEVPVAAVALGASVIEKHFTLDKNMKGPDHRASLDPDELASMVRSIRNIELSLGQGAKQPSASERKNIPVVRKSIIAARMIKKGDLLTTANITTKRPGNGLSPMLWDRVIGTKACRDFKPDELIRL